MKYIWRGFVFIGTVSLVMVILFIIVAAVDSLWSNDYSPFIRLWGMVSNDYGKMLAVYIVISLVFGFLMWGEDK